ncbi:hypothetical protein B0J14DRAFT_612638 [Halenospora varia]|nr:hypothetical protein B0J14DRAFT_612638 [Halenospora varia]
MISFLPSHARENEPIPSKTLPLSDLDYTLNPPNSIPVSTKREEIIRAITGLYSGSANTEDMLVYTEDAIYDDPWSYCEDWYKIAGQWYGIPKIMSTSKTLATEVVSSTDDEPIFKLCREYRPKLLPFSKSVNSLVRSVVYRKDMWNKKGYSHEGLRKVMKTMNGDYLTGITRPPKDM